MTNEQLKIIVRVATGLEMLSEHLDNLGIYESADVARLLAIDLASVEEDSPSNL